MTAVTSTSLRKGPFWQSRCCRIHRPGHPGSFSGHLVGSSAAGGLRGAADGHESGRTRRHRRL